MKKKILFINGHLNTGGVEKSLVDILRNFDYDKYEVDLLLLEEYGDYIKEIPDSVHIRLCSLKNTYGSFINCIKDNVKRKDWFSLKLRLVFLLMKLFGQKNIKLSKNLLTGNKKYDCVIGFRSGICSQIACFAVNADQKFIWWHHGDINVNIKEYSELIDYSDKIISVSKSCAEMLCQEFNNIKDKIVIIPNMIDKHYIKSKSEQFNPYENKYIELVTVSRLSIEKHIENVIYASKGLKDKGYKFKWHIIGTGELEQQLWNLAEENDVLDVIIFEGSCTNPYPYIKNADVYVHTSYVESQGLAILEAMALEIPLVVTESKGPLEFIKNGENGILVKQNVDDLVRGIELILNDHELYAHIKNNLNTMQVYSSKLIISKIENLIDGFAR